MTITGERVTTPEGGFNPTWQRHVGAYALVGPMLERGPVLDLGCGVGHSYRLLGLPDTVGVDLDPGALEGQERRTVVADMRRLPFADGEFGSVVSVHSIEHVPNPEAALSEVVRVLDPGGVAVFVTPNRLTFARPDEIIDPYHYREFDPEELRTMCVEYFGSVQIGGVFGSARYRELLDGQREKLDALLAKDPLRLRRFIPRRVLQTLYDRRLTAERRGIDPRAAAISPDDFTYGTDRLEDSLDVVAVCRRR